MGRARALPPQVFSNPYLIPLPGSLPLPTYPLTPPPPLHERSSIPTNPAHRATRAWPQAYVLLVPTHPRGARPLSSAPPSLASTRLLISPLRAASQHALRNMCKGVGIEGTSMSELQPSGAHVQGSAVRRRRATLLVVVGPACGVSS